MVAVAPLAAPPSSPRGRGRAQAAEPVLAAALKIVLSARERHLHPDPRLWTLPSLLLRLGHKPLQMSVNVCNLKAVVVSAVSGGCS